MPPWNRMDSTEVDLIIWENLMYNKSVLANQEVKMLDSRLNVGRAGCPLRKEKIFQPILHILHTKKETIIDR